MAEVITGSELIVKAYAERNSFTATAINYLIKNVLKNPQFNLEEVDTDMLQRLLRSIDSDSGDLNIISMPKEGDGAQNPELFSISTRLGHQPIQSLTANSIARER